MNRPRRFFLYVLILLIGMTSELHAVEVNQRQRLSPEQQAKVNNALAKSYVYQSGATADSAAATAQGNDCGATRIGTVQPKTPATKVENMFVARGDVIVVNRNI